MQRTGEWRPPNGFWHALEVGPTGQGAVPRSLEGQSVRRQRAVVKLWLAAGIFFALLLAQFYFSAATASVGESYQPGINTVRVPLSPELWLIALVGTPVAISFIPGLRGPAFRFGAAFAWAGIAAALLAFPALAAIDRQLPCQSSPPTTRTLQATLRHSLLCPQFSNRSYAAPFYSVVLGGALLCIVYARRPSRGRPSA